jgi:hypothetical protein
MSIELNGARSLRIVDPLTLMGRRVSVSLDSVSFLRQWKIRKLTTNSFDLQPRLCHLRSIQSKASS